MPIRPIQLAPRTATLVVAASNASAKSKSQADYVCDGTNDQVEIQAAIDALPTGGGKVLLSEGTYDITALVTLPSYTALEGEGPSTILRANASLGGADFQLITNNTYIGGGNTHIVVKNLLIDGNDVAGLSIENTCGLLLQNTKDCMVDKVYTKDCWGKAIRLNSATGAVISGCIDSGSGGAVVVSSVGIPGLSQRCTVVGCIGEGNDLVSGCGCNFCGDTQDSIITGCAYSGYGFGIFLFGGSERNVISGNVCYKNGESGIGFAANADAPNDTSDNIFTGNLFHSNSQRADNTYPNIMVGYAGGNGFAHRNHIIGNTCRRGILANKPKYGIEIQVAASKNNVIGNNDLYDSGSTSAIGDAGTLTQIKNNRDQEITDVKDYVRVKNTSGGALAAGDVVILKSVAAGNEITTTTTQGDDKVFGMVAEAIANNAYGQVQVAGKTVALKVNGVTDIAIGDFLGTIGIADYTTGTALFTNASTAVVGTGTTWTAAMVGRRIKNDASGKWYFIASVTDATHLALTVAYAEATTTSDPYTISASGIAMKAAAGDMAFAIALEAYATNDSLGVIDALIISPMRM